MKVLEISFFHPELVRGGEQQAAYELFHGLREAGVEVTLLAALDPPHAAALFRPGAIITRFDGHADEFLFLVDSFDHTWFRNLNIRALRRFEAFLRKCQPEIVHFHHFLTFGLDLFLLARRTLPDAKLFLTLHEFVAICRAGGHMVRPFDHTLCTHASPVRCHQCFPDIATELFILRKEWVQQAFAVCDGFIVPSAFARERYRTWGIEASKLSVIANAERDRAKGTGIAHARVASRTHNRIAFFGQLIDVKGLLVAFDALAVFADRYDEELIFAINGTNLGFASERFQSRYRHFVEGDHALPKRIRIVVNGGYAPEDLPSRMARTDWVVIPSTWGETFGLVLSEAFMFHRPPIAARVGALAERIHEEEDGLLFERDDASALAEVLHRAITEDGLWERLSTASPGVPAVESIVAAHLEVFEAARRGAPAPGPAAPIPPRQKSYSPDRSRRWRSSSSV